eukprot:m.464420 g.464420  ORF g.464420 m.464420 type:complete len:84 (+) comp248164_c0_seq1:174-425(+)
MIHRATNHGHCPRLDPWCALVLWSDGRALLAWDESEVRMWMVWVIVIAVIIAPCRHPLDVKGHRPLLSQTTAQYMSSETATRS